MVFNATNNKFYIDDTYIDWLSFGRGDRTLVIIAGLNTMTIGGMALPMAMMYRKFADDYISKYRLFMPLLTAFCKKNE